MITDADIEFVARRMCELMGIDPDRRIEASAWMTMTAAQRMAPMARYADYPRRTLAWVTMVPHAERAIAGYQAIQECLEMRR